MSVPNVFGQTLSWIEIFPKMIYNGILDFLERVGVSLKSQAVTDLLPVFYHRTQNGWVKPGLKSERGQSSPDRPDDPSELSTVA